MRNVRRFIGGDYRSLWFAMVGFAIIRMPKEKVVIVSGGAHGIGEAAVLAFAREGFKVALADLDSNAAEHVKLRTSTLPGEIIVIRADVSRSDGAREIVHRTVSAFGGVDVVFNNAGIQPPDSYKTAEHLEEAVWDRVMDVNVKGCFLLCKFAIPEMRKRNGGVIINNASVQGLQSQKRCRRMRPARAPCSPSRETLRSITRRTTSELLPSAPVQSIRRCCAPPLRSSLPTMLKAHLPCGVENIPWDALPGRRRLPRSSCFSRATRHHSLPVNMSASTAVLWRWDSGDDPERRPTGEALPSGDRRWSPIVCRRRRTYSIGTRERRGSIDAADGRVVSAVH